MTKDLPYLVLDGFALLALLEGGAGADRVQAALQSADEKQAVVCLSIISLGETLALIERKRGLAAAQRALSAIDQLPIKLLDATRERVLTASHLCALHRLAQAAAFAAALAQELSGTLLTGDPAFTSIEKAIQIEWLSPIQKSAVN